MTAATQDRPGAVRDHGAAFENESRAPSGRRRVLLRRWLTLILFVVVAVVGAMIGSKTTTQQYETSGTVLVIPPGAGSPVPRDNPFYRINDTAQFANVLASIALGPEGRAVVAKAGASPEYAVRGFMGATEQSTKLSAQITLSVRAPNKWVAREAAMGLIALMRERLVSLQRDAGLRDRTYADLRVVVEPDPGVPVFGNAFRAALGYAIAAMLGVAAILALHASRADTRARRTAGGNGSLRDAVHERTAA
ncbi:Lipopolysaccharide biosynthesis protein OS=Tsukamurella paurometabola (strain ATCC 8368 / DSM/ CCUG 35730 / CIP 100753 / JCM 10117 / KCTC 9821 / NBRC 16120/ NCIMB 702349 / NCTC 13040) OX=521096 GN=Tpau_0065 PE=4 SV=1 [Tsukamurella paurometabola]|uniref:Lipopolysaccharide biosynthesis protein n=1 Tax=Tsukamurella paurometabola (strain ATCC 8368 / DSM 20162 / CCUG 35730 / CIP 100753 / JCM 10117 / KCTC 9821 / NBRC 16120 / NCIMB 702349 / NCTC 13040) TaxID=521096 RepID=D5UPV1_TSUPD|nr:hypothetical protein [Tsukamurella paurometabola]ADG76719.1 lipopolysaccharide biosynthesis protein [Tsukamurella paurometabola DSM 20162]SUP41346.1 Capsular polysaccharide biosynthesis protein [Tsukamurella paurometabola]